MLRAARFLTTTLVAALLVGCAEDTSSTGVTLTISILTDEFAIDELRIRAELPGEAAREVRKALDGVAGESETVNLLFDASAGGRQLTLIVEAFAGGASVLTGRTQRKLVRDQYVTAEVRLLACAAPDGPFCDGDTLVDCDPNKVRTIRTACEHGCNAEGAARCNACTPNTGACDGDSYVSCGGDGLPLFAENCVDNGDPCRTGVCTPNGCITAPANEGVACDDGRFCVDNTICTQGTCGGGTPIVCDDGNACTFDSCDEAGDRCVAAAAPNEGLPCQGTSYCVVQQTCVAGACGGGTPRDCDDDNPCTVDGCDEAGDACTHADRGDGTICDDGLFCTQGDRCQSGACAAGSLSPCADNNPCTADLCDEDNNSCAPTPTNEGGACDDGRYCTENTTCVQGACSGGAPRVCDDGNACTFDLCDETDDRCETDASPNEGLPCQGTSYCVVQQTCSAGSCAGGATRNCEDGNSCTLDGCDESNDRCTHTDKGDGTPCEDGEFCTLGDRCNAGQCATGPTSPCADANPCTNDNCDEVNDACSTSFVASSTTCTDANTATTCDGAGRATNTLCPYGCNSTRSECNECDPDPSKVVTCRADVENLCNAQFVCNPDGLVVFKTCCSSNQCTCDGSQCLEDTCSAALDIAGGGTFTGDTCAGADNVPGDCNPGGVACKSVAQGGGPEAFYRLGLDDGAARSSFYNVVLDTSASTALTDVRVSTVCGNESLQVPNAEVCALPVGVDVTRACTKEPGADVLLLCGLPEGDYFSVVESEAGTCGAYDLDVTVTPATLDTAAEAGNISRGGVFRGNTCALGDQFSFPNVASINGCDGIANCAGGQCPACSASAATDCRVSSQESLCSYSGAGAKDAVFYLALPVDSGVDISTAGSLFDTVLYITQAGPSGATPPGAVRICNDDCFAANGASHIQTSLPAGLYFVILDGAGADCGDYVLDVQVSPAATCPNLSCETPLENCETCPGDCRCQSCGDGAVQSWDGEECDDDGTSAGDGCSASCVIEPGYKCNGSPSVCRRACGDGVLDLERGEQCDDNNVIASDGCSATCTVENGFICTGAPSTCAPGVRASNCPNAAIPPNGTQLNSTINVTNAFALANVTVDVDITHAWIGDLNVQLIAPNSTSVTLHNNTGGSADDIVGNYDATRTPDGPGTMDSFNGGPSNGTWTMRITDSVAVDDGTLRCWTLNLTAAAVCGNAQCEAGQETCASCPGDCTCTNCGNGVLQPAQGELCDDGNPASNDGCSNRCMVESGYKCSGSPSVCQPACGDGIIDPGETCDDANAATPGCSAACQVESGYLCRGAPSVCARGQRVAACPMLAIPDGTATPPPDSRWTTHTLNVTTASCTAIANVTADVDIQHSYIGDLWVELRPPTGSSVRLYTGTTSSADNIIGNYDETLVPVGDMNSLNSSSSNGGWRLGLVDRIAVDAGVLRCWAINVYCQ